MSVVPLPLRTFRLVRPVGARTGIERGAIAALALLAVAVWLLILPLEVALALS